MKKLIILAFAIMALSACKDNTETEKTVITTETTTDPDAPGDETSTSVKKTVETDTSEVTISVEEADLKAIDTTN
jgi:hypothetical protein